MLKFDPIIVFLLAWLVYTLIGEVPEGVPLTVKTALRIAVLIIAIVLVALGSRLGA
jgi:hypothetical protein